MGKSKTWTDDSIRHAVAYHLRKLNALDATGYTFAVGAVAEHVAFLENGPSLAEFVRWLDSHTTPRGREAMFTALRVTAHSARKKAASAKPAAR